MQQKKSQTDTSKHTPYVYWSRLLLIGIVLPYGVLTLLAKKTSLIPADLWIPPLWHGILGLLVIAAVCYLHAFAYYLCRTSQGVFSAFFAGDIFGYIARTALALGFFIPFSLCNMEHLFGKESHLFPYILTLGPILISGIIFGESKKISFDKESAPG
jgi:hypothetical protein